MIIREPSSLVSGALSELSTRRRIFHSEADFQHELAWSLRELVPNCKPRLEHPVPGLDNASFDILLNYGQWFVAIELKYLVCGLNVVEQGEVFKLKNQSARPVRRYDVFRDLARLERFVRSDPNRSGSLIVLSNDIIYWKEGQRPAGISTAFSLRQDRHVAGRLEWAESTGAGTMKGREEPIDLAGRYSLRWAEYSDLKIPKGNFRALRLDVTP